MNESWIQAIAIIGSNLVIMLTFFGVTISLHSAMRDDIRGMQQESREFHATLAKQDREFHDILAKQDREFHDILSKQDLELKLHIMKCNNNNQDM